MTREMPPRSLTLEDAQRLCLARLHMFFGRDKYASFDTVVAGRRKVHRLAYTLAAAASRTRIGAFAAILAILAFLPAIRRLEPASIILFGDTANNRRALADVRALLQEDTRWTKGQAGKRATLSERLRFSGSFFALWKAADIVASRPAAPFLAMQCLVGIAALAFYDTILAKRPCRLLVLANDHSPVATAIMIAARRHGITTVYRQHAPVTPEFPPLIVDVALLYDAASCAAYRSAGEAYPDLLVGRETRMIVLPPFSENCKLIACRGKSRVVGLCLSLVWREAAVIAAIHNLLASGTVNRIIVRPHPANQIDLSPLLMIAGLELDARGRSVADFAKMLDCAIVPNSGVCIELLHHGVPVLYAANMDALGHDLYGFASAGIVPDWTHRPLSDLDDARTFFDADWQERFSAFDASITHDLADLRAEARAALNDYLAEPRAE